MSEEYKWRCDKCVDSCFQKASNEPNQCVYDYIEFQDWQPINKQEEKPESAWGLYVKLIESGISKDSLDKYFYKLYGVIKSEQEAIKIMQEI